MISMERSHHFFFLKFFSEVDIQPKERNGMERHFHLRSGTEIQTRGIYSAIRAIYRPTGMRNRGQFCHFFCKSYWVEFRNLSLQTPSSGSGTLKCESCFWRLFRLFSKLGDGQPRANDTIFANFDFILRGFVIQSMGGFLQMMTSRIVRVTSNWSRNSITIKLLFT